MRLLCVQWAAIGDLLLTTPALSALRQAHPDAHIGLLTTASAAPVVAGTGLVDAIYELPRFEVFRRETIDVFRQIRRDRYDTVMFCHRLTTRAGAYKYAALGYFSGAGRRVGLDNGRGWFLTDKLPDAGFGSEHQAESWLRLASVFGANPAPRPSIIAREAYPLSGERRRIAVHAGSGDFSAARRWPVETLASAINTLSAELDAQVVVVGAEGDDSPALIERLTGPYIDLTGKTSVPQLSDVLTQCDLYIGSDSGVTHIAASVGTPTIAVFGPTNHKAWAPWSPAGNVALVRTTPGCAPCFYVDHELGAREGCPARTCLQMVSPEVVVSAARQLLSGQQPAAGDQRPPASSLQPADGRLSMAAGAFPTTRILGIPVHGLTYEQLLDQIGTWIREAGKAYHVNTINPEFMIVAQSDSVFRHMLRRADLCVPDGVGLLWAARWLGCPMPERITGSDGLPIIAERAAREGWSLFLLGAGEGVADKVAAELRHRYPTLKIVGTFGGSPRGEEESDIVGRVNASGADVLFVAYGTPAQEKWIARNTPRLKVKVAIGVGGSFDFVAGLVPRAPVWMRNAGIEWLYRLYLQPWRIKRMSRLPRFVLAVLRRGSRGAWEI